MSKPRSLVVAVLVLGLGLALAVAVARGGGGGQRPPAWWAPPRDVRAMLGDVHAASLERFDRALVGFGTRHTLSSQTDPNRGIGAARDYIRDQFQSVAARSNGRMSVELQSYVQPPAERVPEPTRITNVIATLQGTDPKSADRVYVVSGHYDSRVTDVLDATSDAPGANDDGSGTSAVLELARVMASRPSEATIVFAAFAGEEQGLYGSNHFAEVAKEKGWNIQGVLNMDIVGSPNGGNGVREPHAIRLFSEGVPTAETPRGDRAPPVDRRGERRCLTPARALHQGDRREPRHRDEGQAHLAPRPLPAQRRPRPVPAAPLAGGPVHEPNENFDHEHQDVRVEDGKQFGDLPEFVDYRYLARVTRVVGSSLAALARAPRPPADARIIAAQLGYDTELRWTANPEPDVVGYEIVWRDSIDPLWTHARRVGNVTDATISGLNKDDVQVAVRAIDGDGNRSPAAYPIPAAQ